MTSPNRSYEQGFVGWPLGSRHLFADPFKVCNVCHGWVDGVVEVGGPHEMIPCGHRQSYESVCPSWSPVDGCTCQVALGYTPHAMRAKGDYPR
jgi:hypothetical protein